MAFLCGHISNDSNDDILVQKYLELRGIIDCSRHDFSQDRVSVPTCEPVLVPTMSPEGSAADIGVKLSDYRVAVIHLRGHLIAKFTILEQIKLFSPCVPGHIYWGCNCTKGVLYIVENHVTWYLRFSHVVCVCRTNFMVSKKTVSSGGSHPKVNIKSVMEAKCLLLGTARNRMLSLVTEFSHRFTFVI